MRVCQNALIYRFTPVTDSCSRGKFLKKGVLTQPHNLIFLKRFYFINTKYTAAIKQINAAK